MEFGHNCRAQHLSPVAVAASDTYDGSVHHQTLTYDLGVSAVESLRYMVVAVRCRVFDSYHQPQLYIH